MATRTLNRPASWQKQVNPNTNRMKALMRDVRGNVVRLTRNSRDLDEWMEKLAPYTASNCFVTGAHADQVREMVNQIAGVVDQTSLPSGANAEIVKGTMAEACMTMVANVGEDIKSELQRIAVESYNAKNTPAQTAQLIGEKIDSLSRSRCQAIARTETCRAANIANYLNAKEMGAKSYSVICNEGACEYCIDEYGEDMDTVYDIEDTDSFPPLHPNCRCTPVWSMDPVESEGGGESETETNDETEPTLPNEYQLNNREDSFSNVVIPKETFDKVIAHQNNRAKAKIEWGNILYIEDGTLHYENDVKGKKNGVQVHRPTGNKSFALLHNHPIEGGFSASDMTNTLTYRNQQVCFATTKTGIWIARETEHAAFMKADAGGINDNTISQLGYKMNGKLREISKEIYERKYQERIQNATTRKEVNAIKKEYRADEEIYEKYNAWLLEEFAVGKRMDALIEMEFIPNEVLENVKF